MSDLVGQGQLVAWVLRRGEDWSRTIICYADEAHTTRRDLTGYTATAEVRSTPEDAAVLLTLDTAIVGALGEVIVSCSHAAADITTWQNGVMDVKLTAPGGAVEYLPTLPFKIDPTVTR